MTITLINGNPENGSNYFDAYVKDLSTELKRQGNTIHSFTLRENRIIPCTGCWGCWVKTPGECLFQEDTREIRDKTIHSDWVIFLSPLIMGFTSALMKKVQDKMIPLLHPYIELVENECHHEKRYDKYPRVGLIYAREKDSDAEDIQIVHDIYQRFALNFKNELALFASIEDPLESITHEVHRN
jgi:multimeric flavodoxin WrbA